MGNKLTIKQKLINKITKLNPEIAGLTPELLIIIPPRLKDTPTAFSWATLPTITPLPVASHHSMTICVTQDTFMYIKDDYYILELSALKDFMLSQHFFPPKIWE